MAETAAEMVQYSSPDDMLEQLDFPQQITTLLVQLTPLQRSLLNALAVNMLADDHVTDTKVAERLGIDRTSIIRARKSPVFGECLAIVTRDVIRGQLDKTLRGIQKHGDSDWRALEFLSKYTGDYIPSSKSQNVNVNLSARQANLARTPTDLLDSILIQLIDLGVSGERVAERMLELQREGI